MGEGEEVPPEMMMIGGMLIDDREWNTEIWCEMAGAALHIRWATIKRTHKAFKLKAVVRRTWGAFNRWKWRKEVAWNPHTALGRRLLQLKAEPRLLSSW